MVVGLDLFRTHFAAYTDQYVLIGGAACTVAMENVGITFRATKDLDIVLCAEALNAEFVAAFWQFVEEGQYESRQKSTGEKQFYRFLNPVVVAYPFMLELFSRAPDALTPISGSHLTPIPMDEEVSSLSAILMNEDYYAFVQSGKQVIDGLQIAGPERLIPLKAKAWLDLSERKGVGENVSSTDVKKHKNDVYRLFAIIDPELVGTVPRQVKDDLGLFLERMRTEKIDLKAMGLGTQTLETVEAELRSIYGLD